MTAGNGNGNGSGSMAGVAERVAVSPMTIVKDQTISMSSRMDALMSIVDANKLLAGLPRHVTPERMKRTFMLALRQNPKLMNCEPASILACVQEAASMGLEVDGVLGHAYLIPFKEECTLVPGFKGLLDMARRHNNIELKTRCVYRGDQFSYSEGDDDRITHIPNQSADALFRDDDVTHVYLVAKREGTVICRSVWTRAQVEAHKKKYSKSWNKSDSPWQTAWSMMARKTLIRDAINRGEIPVSSEIQKLASREEHYEHVVVQDSMTGLSYVPTDDPSAALADILDKKSVEKQQPDKQQTAQEQPRQSQADPAEWVKYRENETPGAYVSRIKKAIAKSDAEKLGIVGAAVNAAAQLGKLEGSHLDQVQEAMDQRFATLQQESSGEVEDTVAR